MPKKERNTHVKAAALTQIFVLTIAICAFSFILAESERVSAVTGKEIAQQVSNANAPTGNTNTKVVNLFANKKIEMTFEAADVVDGKVITGEFISMNTKEKTANLLVKEGGKDVTKTLKLTDTGVNGVGTAVADAGGKLGGKFYSGETPFGKLGGEFGEWTAVGNSVVVGLYWAVLAYGIASMAGSLFGFSEKQTKALGGAAATAAFLYQVSEGSNLLGIRDIITIGGRLSTTFGSIGIGLIIFLAKYKREGIKTISFTCQPYEPPLKGDCEACNRDSTKPCSEYRCKSIAGSCQLLNKESPGKEKCVYVSPTDTISPIIEPLGDALSPSGLNYTPETVGRPAVRGVKIENKTNTKINCVGCLSPFTPLAFGLNVSEPAQCKIDYSDTSFDKMRWWVGESSDYDYYHTQKMRLPGVDEYTTNTTEGGSPILMNDGTSRFFVKCRDASNNSNADSYLVSFKVDKSPDTTPPKIEGTSILSGSYITSGKSNTTLEVYINEPADCRWSIENGDYGVMKNIMSCDKSMAQIRNAIPTCVCNTTLSGLLSGIGKENKYYIRCTDDSNNTMTESYFSPNGYILKGSQALNILKGGPNGTAIGATDTVSVSLELETANGAEEGKAWCSYLGYGTNGFYIEMSETANYLHKQTLQLPQGNYTYNFQCFDAGNNPAVTNATFNVITDTTPPVVARVYKDSGTGTLKIVTDEDAECVYSLSSCDFEFDSGLKAAYINTNQKTNSYLDWKPNTVYYLKCRDLRGIGPSDNACSAVVKPIESSKAA